MYPGGTRKSIRVPLAKLCSFNYLARQISPADSRFSDDDELRIVPADFTEPRGQILDLIGRKNALGADGLASDHELVAVLRIRRLVAPERTRCSHSSRQLCFPAGGKLHPEFRERGAIAEDSSGVDREATLLGFFQLLGRGDHPGHAAERQGEDRRLT